MLHGRSSKPSICSSVSCPGSTEMGKVLQVCPSMGKCPFLPLLPSAWLCLARALLTQRRWQCQAPAVSLPVCESPRILWAPEQFRPAWVTGLQLGWWNLHSPVCTPGFVVVRPHFTPHTLHPLFIIQQFRECLNSVYYFYCLVGKWPCSFDCFMAGERPCGTPGTLLGFFLI